MLHFMEAMVAKVAELKARLAALRSVARERGVSETEAIDTFQHEVETLSHEARIDKFVAMLAEKRARDFVYEHQTFHPTGESAPSAQSRDGKQPNGGQIDSQSSQRWCRHQTSQ